MPSEDQGAPLQPKDLVELWSLQAESTPEPAEGVTTIPVEVFRTFVSKLCILHSQQLKEAIQVELSVRNSCWHCQVCLMPEDQPPRCENCPALPEDCTDPICPEPGCEARLKDESG